MYMIKNILPKASRLTLILLLSITVLAIRPVPVAYAAGMITVNTTTDEFDTGSDCSLREAIQSANIDDNFGGCTRVGTPPYTINVPAGTYRLDIGYTNENNNINGDLDIQATMTIIGDDASTTIIDGNATERVIELSASTAATITNVTITNGDTTPSGSWLAFGGGIYVQSNCALVLNNSRVISNTAVSGGGMYTEENSTSILNNSIISNNIGADRGAGGIGNEGSLVILNNSTVSDNTVEDGGAGGILNFNTMILNNSTVSGNMTEGPGGGIFNMSGTLTLNNSIVSGNISKSEPGTRGHGGGIVNRSSNTWGPAVLNLNHSTIISNTAWNATNAGNGGGGIYSEVEDQPITINITNTIIAGNLDNRSPTHNDCANVGGAMLNSFGYNIIGNNDACSFTTNVGDNFGATAAPVEPGLLPLADNGGDTLTHALGATSPAYNQIPEGVNGCGTLYTSDQRGQMRPFGGACDIGAYETGPDIDVQRPEGNSIADGGVDDVGDQSVGTVNQTYIINNIDSIEQLTVTDVTVSNHINSSDFSVQTSLPLTVPAGISATLQVSYDVNAAGAFGFNMAIANNDFDENPYNIAISGRGITPMVEADLSISKSVESYSTSAITYTLLAENLGPGAVAGAVISDTLPASLSGVSWTCMAANGAACGTTSGNGNILETSGILPPGGTLTYLVSATLPAGWDVITNTAEIIPLLGINDPDLSNNQATATITATGGQYGVFLPVIFSETNP